MSNEVGTWQISEDDDTQNEEFRKMTKHKFTFLKLTCLQCSLILLFSDYFFFAFQSLIIQKPQNISSIFHLNSITRIFPLKDGKIL